MTERDRFCFVFVFWMEGERGDYLMERAGRYLMESEKDGVCVGGGGGVYLMGGGGGSRMREKRGGRGEGGGE